MRATCAEFDTSTGVKSASPPAAWMARTVSHPASWLKSATATRAPSRAKSSAVALPIPDAPPVTKATLSLSLMVDLLTTSRDQTHATGQTQQASYGCTGAGYKKTIKEF